MPGPSAASLPEQQQPIAVGPRQGVLPCELASLILRGASGPKRAVFAVRIGWRRVAQLTLYLDRRTRPGRRIAGHDRLRATRWGIGVEHALNGSGWFPELFRRFIADGLERLGGSAAGWRDAALAGIAEVAALTDHQDFARLHIELFRRLATTEPGQ